MAEATNTELAVSEENKNLPSVDTNDNAVEEETKASVISQLSSIDVLRQITIILALAICLALAVFIMIWAQEPEMRPLGKLETDEMIATLDYLDQNKIPYKLDNNVVYVASDQYQGLRLSLTREGLIQGPSSGEEILMQDMGFGVSQRLERERLQHGREQMLARTIEDLQNIRRARVLLAIPKETVFARREKKPSATVVVTLRRGHSLGQEEIDAIVDIVGSAVHGLEPERITVTDHTGRLLNSGSQDSLAARSRKEYDLERKRELEYMEKIDSIMIPLVGYGNYTAQVDVTMDFTSVEQTQRRYNPDLPALRSEMTIEDNSVGSVTGGVPGALTNQPPLESEVPEEAVGGGAQQTLPGRRHREATRNYELDSTVSHTRQQVGVIRRLSVSVAVNYKQGYDEANDTQLQIPRGQEELGNIRRLLQGGIGFDVQRGDTLEVVTIPFVTSEEMPSLDVPIWEQEYFWRLARLVLGGLVIIVLIFAVIRPMLRRLINPEQPVAEEDRSLLEGPVSAGLEGDFLAAEGALAEEPSEELIGSIVGGKVQLPDLHKDEDVLKAVRALVANEPELAIQVVKGWLEEDAAK